MDVNDEPLPPSDEPDYEARDFDQVPLQKEPEPEPPGPVAGFTMEGGMVDARGVPTTFPIGGPAFEEPSAEDLQPSHRGAKAGMRKGVMVPIGSLVDKMAAELLPQQPPPAERKLQVGKDEILTRAAALQVVDEESYKLAIGLGQDLVGFVKEAEAYFDPDVSRAYTLWNSLTTKRKAFIDPLKEGIEALKARAVTWFQGEETKRREEQRQRDQLAQRLANEEAARKEAAAAAVRAQGDHETANELVQEAQEIRQSPPPAAPVQGPAKVAGSSVKANWVHEVTDLKALVKAVAEGKVSIEAIQANDTYLRGRAKTDKNTWACPGVRFYDKGSMALKGR